MGKVLEHLHLMIRAEVEEPPTDVEFMNGWMRDMVHAIGMQVLDGPRTIYSDMVGNRGLTSSVILNTSNAVLHSWDECSPGLVMIDVYSCGPLDPYIILDHIQVFKPTKIEYMYLDRKDGLHILDRNKITH